MNGLEAAKLYVAVLRAFNYVKGEVEHKKAYIKRVKDMTPKDREWCEQYLPTARTGLKRNRRRLRQVTKLKAALEAALRGLRAKISASDVEALWPAFMDREGRCKPPWKVAEEVLGSGE